MAPAPQLLSVPSLCSEPCLSPHLAVLRATSLDSLPITSDPKRMCVRLYSAGRHSRCLMLLRTGTTHIIARGR